MTVTINGNGTITPTSAVQPTGSILQVVQTVKTDTFTTTSGSATAITGLSVAITPSATSSKILISANIAQGNSSEEYSNLLYLYKGGSVLTAATGDAASNRTRTTATQRQGAGDNGHQVVSIEYLDSPSTTSATTYAIYVSTESSTTCAVNRTTYDADQSYLGRSISTITATEIAG
tara:strand:+ start:601 stop:1128 length:528 start_codon:yes stop_codon:yes gene_type:complete